MTVVFDPYGIIYNRVWVDTGGLRHCTILTEEHRVSALTRDPKWVMRRLQQLRDFDQIAAGHLGVALVTKSLVTLVMHAKHPVAAYLNHGHRAVFQLQCSLRDYEALFT